MAAPNAASVIALMYDALKKTGYKETGLEGPNPISILKLRKALVNGVDAYDSYYSFNCKTPGENGEPYCPLQKEEHTFPWFEGGAGQLNAEKTWKVLSAIKEERERKYLLKTTKYIDDYPLESKGTFIFNRLIPRIDFSIELEADSPESLIQNETLNLIIPESIKWLSFQPRREQKSKLIDLFAAEKTYVRLYVNQKLLTENARLKGGVHFAVIKGFDQNNLMSLAYPIMIVGADTEFEPIADHNQFASRGFIPAGLTTRFFLPVKKPGSSLLIDLFAGHFTPGTLRMEVYHNGIAFTSKQLGSPTSWVVGHPDYGQGRNHLRYLLTDTPPGLYEVSLFASSVGNAVYEDIDGSFYELQSSEISVTIPQISLEQGLAKSRVILKNSKNEGSAIRIANAEVKVASLKKKTTIKIKHQESQAIPIQIPAGINSLEISTRHLGDKEKTDLDIVLMDAQGKPIAKSTKPDSNEHFKAEVKEGTYNLQLLGYSIPAEEDQFELIYNQHLVKPTPLTDKFLDPAKKEIIAAKKGWPEAKRYPLLTAEYENSLLEKVLVIPEYEPVISVLLQATYGNLGQSVSMFHHEF